MFNSLFEAWEARQSVRGRSLARRIGHALGFAGGLAVLLEPMFALVYDAALMLFFLVYTFVFNWAFDRVFGLRQAPHPGAPRRTCPARDGAAPKAWR